MIPLIHPWTKFQEDIEEGWKWKKNTPEEVKKQYEEWEEYCNKAMKFKIY